MAKTPAQSQKEHRERWKKSKSDYLITEKERQMQYRKPVSVLTKNDKRVEERKTECMLRGTETSKS